MITRAVFSSVAVFALLATACSGGGSKNSIAPTAGNNAPATTIVTFGGSATEGDGTRDRLRDAWPYIVSREAMPPSTVLVNAALDGATVASARQLQAPIATEVHAQIAAAWLGVDDLVSHTEVPAFRDELTAFVGEMRAAGARRVVLADIPLTFGPDVEQYNDAIRSVARATRAELVELANVNVPLGPVDGLAPQPTEAGQRAVADAFTRVLGSHP